MRAFGTIETNGKVTLNASELKPNESQIIH